jgi:hypothetical protein
MALSSSDALFGEDLELDRKGEGLKTVAGGRNV